MNKRDFIKGLTRRIKAWLIEQAQQEREEAATPWLVPADTRRNVALHEACHAAFFLAIFREGAVSLQVYHEVQEGDRIGWFTNDLRLTDPAEKHYGLLVVALAPYVLMPRLRKETLPEYGAVGDIGLAWEIALYLAGVEHSPPLCPNLVDSHKEELESAARVIIREALELINEHAQALIPFIRALASRAFEEDLDANQMMEVFARHSVPTINQLPDRIMGR